MPISDYNPIALIEAMLFASPEPVPEEKIREYLQLDGAETKKYLSMLSERYAREESGLSLIEKKRELYRRNQNHSGRSGGKVPQIKKKSLFIACGA